LKNNLSAANSQITDVDVATESTTYAKENILVQTGTAMLAQANALPQSVLKLLS
jgi:flagellin